MEQQISPLAAAMKFTTQLPDEKQSLTVIDAATDASCRKLVVGFSDGTVAIFSGDKFLTQEGHVPAHERSVIRLAWVGGYRNGFCFASTGMDGKICIFRDSANFPPSTASDVSNPADDKSVQTFKQANWQKIFESHTLPSVCPSIAWSPPQYGLIVAAACGDGTISVFSSDGTSGNWATKTFAAHPQGCTAVTWAPFLSPSAINALPLVPQAGQPPGAPGVAIPSPRIATGGRGAGGDKNASNGCTVKVWKYFAEDKEWATDQNLNELALVSTTLATGCCVRDVAWAPNSSGLPFSYLAACSDEGHVVVWRQDEREGLWQHSVLLTNRPNTIPVCRLHWSGAGSVLTTVWKDGHSAMWLENTKGDWEVAAARREE